MAYVCTYAKGGMELPCGYSCCQSSWNHLGYWDRNCKGWFSWRRDFCFSEPYFLGLNLRHLGVLEIYLDGVGLMDIFPGKRTGRHTVENTKGRWVSHILKVPWPGFTLLCVFISPLVIPQPLEMSGFNVAPWPSCVMALKEELRVRVHFPRTLEAGMEPSEATVGFSDYWGTLERNVNIGEQESTHSSPHGDSPITAILLLSKLPNFLHK